MNKEEYIRRYGEAAYKKKQQQSRDRPGPKTVYLAGGGEEGLKWALQVSLWEKTRNFSGSFNFQKQLAKQKAILRGKDRTWVYHNIPSSIVWSSEIHHDWGKGGIMYLLTKEEHSIKTKGERKWQN